MQTEPPGLIAFSNRESSSKNLKPGSFGKKCWRDAIVTQMWRKQTNIEAKSWKETFHEQKKIFLAIKENWNESETEEKLFEQKNETLLRKKVLVAQTFQWSHWTTTLLDKKALGKVADEQLWISRPLIGPLPLLLHLICDEITDWWKYLYNNASD